MLSPIPTPIVADFSPFYTDLFKGFIKGIPQLLASTWYLWVFFIAVGIIKLIITLYRYHKLSKAGIYEIDKITGPEFELFLDSLFSKLGYHTEHTGHTGDFGCDLVIEKDGIRTAVQAKRYKNNVGEDAIREAYSVMNLQKCVKSIVVTNSYFTQKAQILAKSNQVELWNRDKLVEYILQTKQK